MERRCLVCSVREEEIRAHARVLLTYACGRVRVVVPMSGPWEEPLETTEGEVYMADESIDGEGLVGNQFQAANEDVVSKEIVPPAVRMPKREEHELASGADIAPTKSDEQLADAKLEGGLPENFVKTDPPIQPVEVTIPARKKRKPLSTQGPFHVPTLRHFCSSTRIPQTLEHLVLNSLSENRRLEHTLIHGRMGCGSMLLARALVRELAATRVVEIEALRGCTPVILSRAINRVADGGVLLVRHIEMFDENCDSMLIDALGDGNTPVGEQVRRSAISDSSIVSLADFDPTKPLQNKNDDSQDALSKHRKRLNFTLIATAHLTSRIGYRVRTRFEHLVHLRKDQSALREAVVRSLQRRGLAVTTDAYPTLERILASVDDCAEHLARCMRLRAEIEGVDCIDADLARSIITEDLPTRLPDEQYAAALTRHLCGRRIKVASDEEISRLVEETGWGEAAVRGALMITIREESARRTKTPNILT